MGDDLIVYTPTADKLNIYADDDYGINCLAIHRLM